MADEEKKKYTPPKISITMHSISVHNSQGGVRVYVVPPEGMMTQIQLGEQHTMFIVVPAEGLVEVYPITKPATESELRSLGAKDAGPGRLN